MTKYTYAQLEGLWIANGGSRATAPIAAAIAEAESGGESTATSSNPDGGTNVGLWQLDTRGVGAGFSVAQLQSPSQNAQVARKGSNDGKNWGAWETFVTGAYKRFMSNSTTPANPGAGAGAGGGGATTTASIQEFTPESCLWSFPGIQIPVIGNAGQFCILSKSQARAMIGGALLAVAGLTLILPGLAFLAAGAGVKALGAAGPVLEKTGAAVALVPGAEMAGVAIAGAGRAGRSSAAQTRQRRGQGDAQAERALGEPRENPELRTGRGAVRENPAETRRRQSASRSRARRTASTGTAPASRAEAGF
jgi:Lysozyme like domain